MLAKRWTLFGILALALVMLALTACSFDPNSLTGTGFEETPTEAVSPDQPTDQPTEAEPTLEPTPTEPPTPTPYPALFHLSKPGPL
ncbi:MAG TPA: hypothetical protein PLA25_11955, partial [Anaerolineaceae bacterium]|nr:hypothetical protein [Anaerolineaceae bacterium]